MTEKHSDKQKEWSGITVNPWRRLRQFTAARIGLGRSGISLPTKELLEFQLAHAQARDAVHTPLNCDELSQQLEQLAQKHSTLNSICPIKVHSQAVDRMAYLQRPDLGRRLDDNSRELLQQPQQIAGHAFDLAIVIADGLSATAITENALPFIQELMQTLEAGQAEQQNLSLAPLTIVTQGRVAIGDDIGELLNAKAVLVMIGERPGLSSPDSLGLYLTWAPKQGLTDEKRNCISNVRKAGLSYTDAVRKLLYLFNEARRLQCSGVAIKDRSDDNIINSSSQTSFLLHNNND